MTVNTNYQTAAQETNTIDSEIAEMEALAKKFPFLGAMLNEIIKTLDQIKADIAAEASAAPEAPSDPNNGPITPTLCANMGEMMALLSQLESVIAQLTKKRAENDNEMDNDMIKLLQSNVKEANKQCEKLIKEQKKSDFWGTFLKVVEGIVAGIVAVIALACGQPELAIMVVALAVISISGGFQEATKLIGDLLQKMDLSGLFQKMGMSKEEADEAVQVVASAIVVVATIAVTIATCGAAAPEAVVNVTEDTAETSVEMVDMGENIGQTTEETAESAASQSTSRLTRALNFIKENNPMNKLPKGVNMSFLSGSQALMQTNFVNNIIEVVATARHMSESEKQKLEMILTIIVDVTLSIVGIFSGMAAAGTASSVSADSALGRLTSQFQSIMAKTPGLMTTMQVALTGAMGLQATGQGMLAKSQFDQASIQETIGEYKGTQDILQQILSMINSDAQENNKSQTNSINAHSQENMASIISFAQSQNAIAQQMA